MNQQAQYPLLSVNDNSPPPRRIAIDVARALAIIGMIAVNVGPQQADDIIGKIFMLPFGRASLLFMVLAGLGLGILTHSSKNRSKQEIRLTIIWRAALLFLAGLILQQINHGASVILTVYGLLFLCILPLTQWRTRTLAILTAALTFVAPLLWITVLSLRGLEFQGIPITLDANPLHVIDGMILTGPYPAMIWIVPILAGLTLSRLNLSNRRLQRTMMVGGLVLTVGSLAVSRVLTAVTGIDPTDGGFARLLASYDHSQAPLWLVSGIGSAIALLGFLLLIETWLSRRAEALANLGRLSLTMYVAHLILIAIFVRPDPHTTPEGIAYALLISIFCIVCAHAWVVIRGQGPLERFLRPPLFLRRLIDSSR
ncbi:DUF418 domain-containing protein [Glutamicibacter ardleyensis]|uniref:Transporter n=1 Tax=Glutamicibacter ardleyensis TaxID=225894 RepID=A0ABQ2DTB7_9MICC|nr:DUF418 domain-containing protein [Glutamicibacter ardleyensis]GGJ71497.1 transporter [Glutamicibacter ardleyensis]